MLEHSIGIPLSTIDKIIYIVESNHSTSEINEKHIIWSFLYWFQYLSITEICATLQISARTFSIYYKTINVLFETFKSIMDQRYHKLVDSCSFLEHPVTKVMYRSIAADSTSIRIQTPVDYEAKGVFYISKGYRGAINDAEIAKDIYTTKDEFDKPKTYSNGETIYTHDEYPILGDKAYKGLSNFIVPFNRRSKSDPFTLDEKLHNNFVSTNRVFIEHLFLKLKKFKVFSTVYRGSLEDLSKIGLIICFSLELGENYGDGFDFVFEQSKLSEINSKRKIKFG
ncbi:hypothetical protein ACTFIY_005531 [Dictyostelium cf. discoideum]